MTPKNEYHHLKYLEWSDIFNTEKPYTIVSSMPWLPDSKKNNLTFTQGPEELISDIRGRENEFTLDQNGFAFVSHSFSDFDVSSHVAVETIFYPEAEEFLRRHVEGVDRVLIFDYRVRSNEPRSPSAMADIANNTQALPPARGVHLDQSSGGALKRVRLWTREEADLLIKGRVRIINIWLPYDHPIEDCPLALCDGSTVRPSDLIVVDHITRTYIGETVYPIYNENVKWYYLSDQKPDEVLLFKIFDSDENVPAQCEHDRDHISVYMGESEELIMTGAPHTAFELHDKVPDARPRKSFELRALVFTYPEGKEKSESSGTGGSLWCASSTELAP